MSKKCLNAEKGSLNQALTQAVVAVNCQREERFKRRLFKSGFHSITSSLMLLYASSSTVDHMHMSTQCCSVCTQYQKQLKSIRKFGLTFIHGTINVCIYTIKDHAGTDIHAQAMRFYKKQWSSQVYRSLVQWPMQSSMDASARRS